MEHVLNLPDGKRLVSNSNEFEGIDVAVVVDPTRFSLEEHEALAGFVMRAIVAFLGSIRHRDQVEALMKGTQFRFYRPVTAEVARRVHDVLHFAFSLVVGFDSYIGRPDEEQGVLH